MNVLESDVLRIAAVRLHALVTALLGGLYLVYHTRWIGQADAPFLTPDWLINGQLVWVFISFALIFVYQREDRSPVLPALYVTLTGATYSYIWYLEVARGSVSDDMVPSWWKVMAGSVGLVLFLEGLRQVRLKPQN